jgi:uncharacterized protein YijF (DUF1287 family)
MHSNLASVILCALLILSAVPALADDCSDMSTYAGEAHFGLKDAQAYIDDGNLDSAKLSFDAAAHDLDVAAQSVDACTETNALRDYALGDAIRWRMGHDQLWVDVGTAAVKLNSDLRVLFSIGDSKRDREGYDALQTLDKAYYREAGFPWDPIK